MSPACPSSSSSTASAAPSPTSPPSTPRTSSAWTEAIFAYAWYYPVVELLSSVAIALVIWRGGYGILHKAVDIGILIAFIQYAQRFFRPIQDLSEKYNILQAAMAASERVFKLLDTPPTILSPAHPIPGNASGSIEFRNVWFTYQTDSRESHKLGCPSTSRL